MKTYQYKVYDRASGSYLGSWSDVTSDFELVDEMATAGSRVDVTLARPADQLGTDVVVGNNVKIYVFDENHPNGLKKFDGFINGHAPHYSGNEEMLQVHLLSYGIELDNNIIEVGSGAQYLTQTTETAYGVGAHSGFPAGIAQTFTATSNDKLTSISVRMVLRPNGTGATSCPVELKVFAGNPLSPGAQLASAGVFVDNTDEVLTSTFDLGAGVNVTNGSSYYFQLTALGVPGTSVDFAVSTTNVYSGGRVYSWDTSTNAWSTGYSTYDMWFVISRNTGNTTTTLSPYDPSGMMKEIINAGEAKGGRVSFTNASIQMTGRITGATFNLQTALEGIRKANDLSPSGWYWYLDQASNLVHHLPRPTTAAHVLTLGRHLTLLDLDYTTNTIVNTIYFIGGETLGVPLLKKYSDAASIAKYGQRVRRIVDPAVKASAEADVICQTLLARLKNPTYRATIEVPASEYDIEGFVLGQLIRLRGSTTMDSLPLLQDVRQEYNPDKIRVHLDGLPPDLNRRVDNLGRGVQALASANNPAAPS